MSAIGRRAFISTSAAAIAATAIHPQALFAQPIRGQIDKLGRFGSLLNRQEFALAPQALDPEILALFASQTTMHGIIQTGPAKRHILAGLPPIFMQGTNGSLGYPGSCEACSFGYCLGTYTASRGYPGFNILPRDNHASVAWLFEWAQRTQHRSGCGGSLALPYLSLMVAQGAPSAVQVPYKPNCTYIDGLTAPIKSYPGIAKFRIGSYKALPNFLNAQKKFVKTFKQYINAGHAIAFSGLVANAYDNPGTVMYNGAFDPAASAFITGSGHGQVIVGYDEALGHTGAFLIQNSFGKDWPYLSSTQPLMQGRLWWTFEAFFASQGFGAIAYPIQRPVVFPGTIVISPQTPGAPVVRILEAVRGVVEGEGVVALEMDFDQPMHLDAIRVTPVGTSTPIVGTYNGAIKYGFAHVTRSGAFPPGRYAVELDAHTLSSDLAQQEHVTYRGFVRIS